MLPYPQYTANEQKLILKTSTWARIDLVNNRIEGWKIWLKLCCASFPLNIEVGCAEKY